MTLMKEKTNSIQTLEERVRKMQLADEQLKTENMALRCQIEVNLTAKESEDDVVKKVCNMQKEVLSGITFNDIDRGHRIGQIKVGK